MSKWFFIPLLALSILLEGTVTTVPLVVSAILLYFISSKDSFSFVFAFTAGLILDIMSVRSLGQTSLFLVVFLFVIALYERKFEIATLAFVTFSSFVGSISFLMMFGYNLVISQAIANSFITSLLFLAIQGTKKKREF